MAERNQVVGCRKTARHLAGHDRHMLARIGVAVEQYRRDILEQPGSFDACA